LHPSFDFNVLLGLSFHRYFIVNNANGVGVNE
jgi:hypothetical protein